MKKIALIGIGKMGLSHLAIANMTPGIEVVAICDVSKMLLRVLRKNIGIKTFQNYKEMIKTCQPDGVLICVPNALHFDISKHCIENKINVFIEKPMTLKFSESQELCLLAANNRVKGQVGYVNRFNPIFQRVKKLLDQNLIGEIKSYTNKMVGGVILKENIGWRNDYAKGGGCLFDYGPHCFDLAAYFFGSDIKVVSASLNRVFSTKVDDIVSATFQHNGKIIGKNLVNWSVSSARKASNSIEIYGTKGKIIANKQEIKINLDEADPAYCLPKGDSYIYITDESTDALYYLRGEDFTRQMISFSDLLNGKIENSLSSLEDGRIIDLLIELVFSVSGGLS